MPATTTGVDFKSAPPDYAALFSTYYTYIVNLVHKHGIDDNNKEDVASELVARLIENKAIEKFDPDLVFEYDGQVRPARFKSFLSRYVCIAVRGLRDRQKRLARHEVQICGMLLGNPHAMFEGANNGGGNLFALQPNWVDLYGEPQADFADDVIEMIGEEQDAVWMRTWLATRPQRFSHDRCDLVELFDAVRTQVLTQGTYNIADLERQFEVSTTAMHNWMWWLKRNVAAAYNREVPAKRARTLSPTALAKLAAKKEEQLERTTQPPGKPKRAPRPRAVIPTPIRVKPCGCRNPDCPGKSHS